MSITLRYEALAEVDPDALTVRMIDFIDFEESRPLPGEPRATRPGQRPVEECPADYTAVIRLIQPPAVMLVLPSTLPAARRALDLEYLRRVHGLTRAQAGEAIGLTLRQSRSLHEKYRSRLTYR